jgi:hypothetical protein
LNTLRYADRVKELRKPKHEKESENAIADNHYKLTKKEKEKKLLDELLMMPKGNNNVKYNVEIKNGDNEKINNLIINHNYNFMKIKNKNNLIEQNLDIQKPDSNILKIDDVIKNEKIHSKYAFKKNNNRNSSKQKHKISDKNLLINSDIEIGNNINSQKNMINIDEYESKYKGIEIKNDEEYNKLSQIHEELIDEILKGEDEFINDHKSHIDNMVECIKNEMNFIHEVDKPGSDIEEYTSNLDKLLLKEIQTISNLRNKLTKFHIMIKDENALANLFEGEDEKFSVSGFEGGESTNSLDEFFSHKESLNKKIAINSNENNKYNFQSKKK